MFLLLHATPYVSPADGQLTMLVSNTWSEQEYKEGILVRHSALDPVLIAAVFGKKEPEKLRRRATMKAAALQGKHVVKLGQVVYKDNSSYDLMLNLQLGIRYGTDGFSEMLNP